MLRLTPYAGHAPWDIGSPQMACLDVTDRITGSVLDASCGNGENALCFAGRDCVKGFLGLAGALHP